MKKKALFITFEGGEGSGKSTHIKLLKNFLEKKGLSVCLFREPGSTKLGEKIRKILLYYKSGIYPITELFLYLAARAEFITGELSKALSKYDVVICDRFADSTLVYQGCGLKLGINKIKPIVEFASGKIKPDLTIVLDVGPAKGLLRIKRKKDRIEQRSIKFHRDLRKGYKMLAKKEPQRIKIIKVKTRQETQDKIIQTVKAYVR